MITKHDILLVYKQTQIQVHLFNGALEFVHVAFKEREMGEEEILEATVFLRVGRQHEDDPDGDLLLASHAEAWSTTFIRHVEALLHWPGGDTMTGNQLQGNPLQLPKAGVDLT